MGGGSFNDRIKNAKGKTAGKIDERDKMKAAEALLKCGFPTMNPCVRGSHEFVTDEDVQAYDDAEYMDIARRQHIGQSARDV